MKITDDLRRHLAGDAFSNGLRLPIVDPGERVHDRGELLVDLARGKRVVHVGCVDHLPLLEAKIANGTWLHARLADAAAACVGVDINAAGIDLLRSRHGRTDVVVCDLMADGARLPGEEPWDLVILADMVEHLDDPVGFLRALRESHGARLREAVVTVPNAFSRDNRRLAQKGIEFINTDHRWWFTPFTIAKVARRAGWHPRWIAYADALPPSRLGRARRGWRRGSPAAAETVVLAMAPDA